MAAAPPPLADLLADGTLAEVVVEPSAVLTRLGAGRSWAAAGARVRTALHAALASPAGWLPAAIRGSPTDPGAALERLAQDAVVAVADPYARSHGGSVTLVAVSPAVVTVRLGGACSGCPMARWSVLDRLTRELLRHSGPVRVVACR